MMFYYSQGSHLNFKSRSPGLLLFQKYESHLKNRSPILKKWSPKDFNMKFYPKKPCQLNSNLTCLVRILLLKLSCDTVPEVAKGQGAEVEKCLHGMGEGRAPAVVLYLDIN